MIETIKEFFETTYFIPDTFTKKGGVWLLRIGHNIAKPEYNVEPRSIEYYNIHFVMQGKVTLLYNQKQVILEQGDSFCMYPGALYGNRYHFVEDERPLKMIWVSFDGIQSRTLLEKAGYNESTPYLKQVMTTELFNALQQLFVTQGEGFKRQLEQMSTLYRIFGCITSAEVSAPPVNGPSFLIPKSIEYMKTHYMERITVQDVAAFIGVHRAYLSKIFTEKMGMSPIRYLEKLRMEKAIDLLRTSGYSIHEIGSTLGYPDPYTFTHAFSRYYSIPPGKWRKQNGGT